MQSLVAVVLLISVAVCAGLRQAEPMHLTEGMTEVKCAMTPEWPPAVSRTIPTYVVDLDAPAATRWNSVIIPRATGIDVYAYHFSREHMSHSWWRAAFGTASQTPIVQLVCQASRLC
jgi:hypothetical protein